MNTKTMAMDSGHTHGFYLAEGETPDSFQTVPAGIEKNDEEPGEEDDLPLSPVRRFDCARRTGAKVADTPNGPLLIEIAA